MTWVSWILLFAVFIVAGMVASIIHSIVCLIMRER